MKTASLTAPLYLSAGKSRNSPLRYLPHALIAALLVALLLVASRHGYTGPLVNFSLSHLGPH